MKLFKPKRRFYVKLNGMYLHESTSIIDGVYETYYFYSNSRLSDRQLSDKEYDAIKNSLLENHTLEFVKTK